MANVRRVLRRAALYSLDTTEWGLDRLGREWRRRLGTLAPPVIQPYRGFGTATTLYAWGRVLEDRKVRAALPEDTIPDNVAAMFRRFASREMPRVRVKAQFQDVVREVATDREGYFHFFLQPSAELPPDRNWHEVALSLASVDGTAQAEAVGQVLVPPVEAEFGIISDIDDTVLQSGVTKRWELVRNTLLRNAHMRLPFEGVAGLYRALQRGITGRGQNPIFYVSSSPWNLYDVLEHFLELQGIPQGPLFLRDLGIDREKFFAMSTAKHKARQIERIMDTYPGLKFILIGDSGQEDPEIYRDAVNRHPGRILAIYIRDVAAPAREEAVHRIAQELAEAGVEMVLTPDSEGAARHAAQHHYIVWEEVPEVQAEKAKDIAIGEEEQTVTEHIGTALGVKKE
jgi:phosphatidate phosphatase APP1